MKSRFLGVIVSLVVFMPALSVMNSAFAKDMATKEAQYLKRVEKDRIKEEYGRKIMDRHPSGYMTVDEYEALSKPKDKMSIDYGAPQVEKPYDMQFVPHPIYKLARYNDPPGSPDLSVKLDLFKNGQMNLPGITAPDFTFMVYPAVYYYPERKAVACDLFMVALRDNDSSVNKILKANIAHRFPEPILSTDKELTNSSTYRTLTPIDFSADSRKLLVKEKIGSSADGIWQTNIIVYDFSKRTSYNLVEVRDAISYYWKEYKGLDLVDKRWDVYPLGFSKGNPDRIMVTAYAYTGDNPVFLGVWSIDYKGEQSRLISLNNASIEVASNGFKIVKDGALDKTLIERQEKFERDLVKKHAAAERKEDRAEVKEMKAERKEKLKEVNKQYKLEKEDYRLMDKLKGTTEYNDNIEKYNELQEALDKKREIKAEKLEKKAEQKELNRQGKELRKQEKAQRKADKEAEKAKARENKPPKGGTPTQNEE